MPENTKPESKAANITLWILQVLAAVAFLAAGSAKLTGQPMMVQTFAKIGIGQWFRYLTGGIEVISAILMLIPRTVPIGAGLLVATMVGAVTTHLLIIGGNPAPPAVLLLIVAIIALGRRGRLAGLLPAASLS